MLAAKAALATRVDALGEDGTTDLGIEHRANLTARLRMLEDGNLRRISGTGKSKAKTEKYQFKRCCSPWVTVKSEFHCLIQLQ
jgi:nucleolar protein 58